MWSSWVGIFKNTCKTYSQCSGNFGMRDWNCNLTSVLLGHVLSQKGILTNPQNTEKVHKWPVPCSTHAVKLLQKTCARFCHDCQAHTCTSVDGMHGRVPLDPQCQDAFEELRSTLIAAPTLAFPGFGKEFILDADSSDTSIGTVLSREQSGGTERITAYASLIFKKSKRTYCVTRCELLAVVTFVHHSCLYLLQRGFTIRTDHGPVTGWRISKILRASSPSG